ncbi:hypothetical protein [Roseateles sp.]|uniref:hypothetical protein n=1 Tax=Roseateles sp. TaxID=1971397 RepID=UPI003262D82D
MAKVWLSKPLCCRYVLAEFKTLRLPVRDGAEVRDMSWRWALGLFKPGQYEVLGAWPAGAASVDVAHDLHQRGIEQLTAISADAGMDCSTTFPDAVCWSSVSELNSTSVSAAGSFGPRRRAALRSAAATAQRLQIGITRTIKRRGPFADDAAAAAFLAQALERADRRLYGT